MNVYVRFRIEEARAFTQFAQFVRPRALIIKLTLAGCLGVSVSKTLMEHYHSKLSTQGLVVLNLRSLGLGLSLKFNRF